MSGSYFERLNATTPTRLWINNPTSSEVGLALAQGAAGCTTNPAFGGGLLKRAPEEVEPVIAACVGADRDDDKVADRVQQLLVGRIAEQFMPLFEASAGRAGLVSIQGAPEADEDADRIFEEGLDAHSRSPNITPKIPATPAGLEAFERFVESGINTIITEVFSLAQVEDACERYLRVASRVDQHPQFFMSPITGIFGDYLASVAAQEGKDVDAAILQWAGVGFARRCQALVEERSYPVTLLFGGARSVHDFTGLVGARTAATVNYSTVAAILAADPPIEATIDAPTDPLVIAGLEAFEDYRRATRIDGLRPEEFASFGPVQYFRDVFVAGWATLRAAVAETRLRQGS